MGQQLPSPWALLKYSADVCPKGLESPAGSSRNASESCVNPGLFDSGRLNEVARLFAAVLGARGCKGEGSMTRNLLLWTRNLGRVGWVHGGVASRPGFLLRKDTLWKSYPKTQASPKALYNMVFGPKGLKR